jgi:precorrin-3B C17-methyltransferase
MTFRAKKVIEESDTIVGYTTYVNLVQDLIAGKDVYQYAMTQEVERAQQCIDLAKEGKTVSLVSSGDPGIYGMAGLIYEDIIIKRVEAAAQGDFVIVIYNPASKKRIHQLQDTRKILLKYRKPSTPVAIIKGAYRESQTVVLTDLENLEKHSDKLGMISTVIVGNSSTYNYKDLMINPRGYTSKYNLGQTNPEIKTT